LSAEPRRVKIKFKRAEVIACFMMKGDAKRSGQLKKVRERSRRKKIEMLENG